MVRISNSPKLTLFILRIKIGKLLFKDETTVPPWLCLTEIYLFIEKIALIRQILIVNSSACLWKWLWSLNEFCWFPFSDSGNLPKGWPINLRNKNKFIKISRLHFNFYIIFSCYKCLDVINLHLNKSIFNDIFLYETVQKSSRSDTIVAKWPDIFFKFLYWLRNFQHHQLFSLQAPRLSKKHSFVDKSLLLFFNSFHLNLSNQWHGIRKGCEFCCFY